MQLEFSNGQVVKTEMNPITRLPELRLFHDVHETAEQVHTALYSCVTDEQNQNTTPAQKRLLRLHFRLGHLAMDSIQWLAKTGALGKHASVYLAKCDKQLCGTCLYAKQTRRPTGVTRTEVRQDKEGGMKREMLEPGDGTAIDQFEVVKRGRLFNSRGRERPEDRYCGGTIFVDLASGRVRCFFQHSLGGDETVRAKLKYEREARQYNVFVKSYRSDNGVFTATEFQAELMKSEQPLTLSGVGAHHQNSVAERAIRTVVTRARALLLHAMLRWPDVTTLDLWPMAMQHAELLVNQIPKQATGYTPLQLFSRDIGTSKIDTLLEALPVWGCPTYVLNPTLQDGKKLPKWQPRSRRGQYMGLSPFHASNVALVRNIKTGHIGPQYHVVHDNWFETVHVDDDAEPPEWEVLVMHSRFQANFDEDDLDKLSLDDEWLTKDEIVESRERILREREKRTKNYTKKTPRSESSQPTEQTPDTPPTSARTNRMKARDARREAVIVDPPVDQQRHPDPPVPPPTAERPVEPPEIDVRLREGTPASKTPVKSAMPERPPPIRDEDSPINTTGRTRSGKVFRSMLSVNAKTERSIAEGVRGFLAVSDHIASLMAAKPAGDPHTNTCAAIYAMMLCTDPDDGLLDWNTQDPRLIDTALKATKHHDADTPTLRQAMCGPYAQQFKEGMVEEIANLTKIGTYEGVLRSSLPKGTNVIPSTWAFKIKRWPSGEIARFRARFCVRGDKQIEGIDVFDTYAPVVAWPTVRTILAFALQKGMKTRQIDFQNAFATAELPPDANTYIEPPEGFVDPEGRDVVLKLKKSLYGTRDAPINWFNKISKALTSAKFGFKQSSVDKCLFLHPSGMLVLMYVDDCMIFDMSAKAIDAFIDKLRGDFLLTEEQVEQDKNTTVYQYLGIELVERLDKHGKPTIMMRQTKLIDKILKATKMTDCEGKPTPAIEKPLGADANGPAFDEEWDYASVVGMCMYLVNTRPDCQFSVHQCARFTHAPRKSHAVAIKRLCRYLKKTRDKGLVYRPTIDSNELRLDAYCDADFSSLFSVEDTQDPVSSRSRSGYVFLLGNCPVLWASRLQGETALSVLESEYISLSTAMRELIPMRRLVKEIATTLKMSVSDTVVKSKIFEDNAGVIAVATAPYMTPRTKHINTKYHFFKSHIGKEKGITIQHVATTYQLADLMTKGVEEELFTHLADMLMGWDAYG